MSKRNKISAALAAVMLMGLVACAENFRNHGYLPSEKDLEQVVIGVDTRESLSSLIGAPPNQWRFR